MNLSIIILVNNEEKTIKKQVEDIKKKIINKIKKVELIILHDGNTDETHKILLKLKNKNRLIIYATHNRFFANMADCKLEMIGGNIKTINARIK